MRARKQVGQTTVSKVLALVAIAGILIAVIGGNYAERNAKIQKAIAIEEKWQEKSCDYFNYRASEEMKNGDAEKMKLYHKLFGACLQLKHTQSKTPE